MTARALGQTFGTIALAAGLLAARPALSAPVPAVYGDADGNGTVNATDRDEALAALLGTCGLPTYAVSNDSEYTIKDVLMIAQFGGGAGSWTETDLDGDGVAPVGVAINQGNGQTGAPLATLPTSLRIQATWRSITGLCNNPVLAPAWFNRNSDTTGGALLSYNAVNQAEHNNVTVDGSGLSSGVSLILGSGEGAVGVQAGYQIRKAGGTTVDTTQTVNFSATSVAPCGGDMGDALQILSYAPATSKWANTVTGDSLCVVYDESLDKTATEATCAPYTCTVSTTTVVRDTVCFNVGAGSCGASGNLTWTATACNAPSGTLPGSQAYRLSDTPVIPPSANARGGVGGGFLNGSIQVCVVDAATGGSLGGTTEVMVSSSVIGNTYQTGTNFRSSIAGGGACTTLSHVNIVGPLSVTAAAVGHKVVTIADIDARVVVIPMEKRSAARLAEAEAAGTLYEVKGSINLTSLNTGIHTVGSTYVAPTLAGRHGHCQGHLNPNPSRVVLANLGFKNRPLSSLTLADFQAPRTIKSIQICNGNPTPQGIEMDQEVPGNLIAPDFMYNGFEDTFSRLLTTAGTDIPVQVLGLSISPEWASPTAAIGVDFDQLEFYVTVQDMAIIDVNNTNCPGNICNLDDTVKFPTAGEFNLNPASGALGYGYSYAGTCPSGHGSQPAGKCYWEKHRLNWDLDAEFVIRGVQGAQINNTVGSNYQGSPIGPVTIRYQTDKPSDPDFSRKGSFFCDGAACDQNGEYQSFLFRDVDGTGRKLEAMYIYGMQVTAGLLGGYFLPINLSMGGEVHCPPSGVNGVGNTCYGWMPLGGPTQAAMETYVNNLRAGSVTASKLTSLATWFKKEPRGTGKVWDDVTSQAGPNPINPTNRTGNYLMHAWGTDEVIGLPYGWKPSDPGASSGPAHCIDSPTPGCKFCSTGTAIGKSCRAAGDCTGGGTCTTITQATGIGFFNLATRDLTFTAAAPSGVTGSFNRNMRLARHDLSVDGNCFDIAGQIINTTTGILGCGDPAWSVYSNGPGAAGSAVTFKLPDITGMGDAVAIPDWRYVLGTGTGQLGAGFAEVNNYQYKQCVGGSNPNTSCTFKADACLSGGTCTNITNGTLMTWSQLGVGGNSVQSCSTLNNWHYSQTPTGGNGGFIDSDFFSTNRQTLLYKDN